MVNTNNNIKKLYKILGTDPIFMRMTGSLIIEEAV